MGLTASSWECTRGTPHGCSRLSPLRSRFRQQKGAPLAAPRPHAPSAIPGWAQAEHSARGLAALPWSPQRVPPPLLGQNLCSASGCDPAEAALVQASLISQRRCLAGLWQWNHWDPAPKRGHQGPGHRQDFRHSWENLDTWVYHRHSTKQVLL